MKNPKSIKVNSPTSLNKKLSGFNKCVAFGFMKSFFVILSTQAKAKAEGLQQLFQDHVR